MSLLYVPESTEEEKEEHKPLVESIILPSVCFLTEVKNMFIVFFN